MIRNLIVLVCAVLCSGAILSAQTYEEQALDILKLYEGGQTDTAYWLIEPLKRNARFIPAALYVRAQMTPDDRALNLYREVIALEPNGAWADEAAYQLVRRYVDKRDSLASWAWYSMLNKTYPQSPYTAKALSVIEGVSSWQFEVEDEEVNEEVDTEVSENTKDAESATEKVQETSTTDVEGQFKGYALQVGLFPTKEAAEQRVRQLNAKSLQPEIFPKDVNGKRQYALVVGPYESRAEASKAKERIIQICECGAFTVLVE